MGIWKHPNGMMPNAPPLNIHPMSGFPHLFANLIALIKVMRFPHLFTNLITLIRLVTRIRFLLPFSSNAEFRGI